MPEIEIIAENGERVTREVLSRNVAFFEVEKDYSVNPNFEKLSDNDSVFKPKVAQRIEWDHQADVAKTTTVCGETEKRRDADEGPEITIEGVITEEQIPRIKALKSRNITLISDVHSGRVYIGRVTIEQNTDVIHYIENGQEQLAFTFQIQTGKQDE